MPFGIDLKKFKLDEKSPAAKFVNPALEKLDALLSKLEQPKAPEAPQTPPAEEKKEEEKK
ncbi:MAG: hypothetical protein M1561_01455 [Gammaproteobacteria bacterium]|nr:hypothetical protein [Gammaproteobacteria bacterium]